MSVFTFTGAAAALAALTDLADRGTKNIAQAVDRATASTATQAKAGASGRPGPNVITGDFRRSITNQKATTEGSEIAGYVGSNAAQARRLELGFVGTDALGRNYNQPPYPWLTPTIPYARDQLGAEVAKALGS